MHVSLNLCAYQAGLAAFVRAAACHSHQRGGGGGEEEEEEEEERLFIFFGFALIS